VVSFGDQLLVNEFLGSNEGKPAFMLLSLLKRHMSPMPGKRQVVIVFIYLILSFLVKFLVCVPVYVHV
jgi:hypothetical protein